MNPTSPIQPTTFLAILGACTAGAAIWVILRGRGRSDILAVALLWMIGIAPFTVTVVRPRQFAVDFLIPVGAGLWIRVSQLFVLVTFALAAICILLSKKNSSHAGTAVALAALAMYFGPILSAVLGGHGGLSESLLIAPVVLFAAYRTAQPPLERLVRHARYIVRLYIYGSLIAYAISPTWATYRIALYEEQYLQRAFFGIPQLVGVATDPNILGPLAAVAVTLEVVRLNRGRVWALHAAVAFTVLLLAQSPPGYLAAVVSLGVVLSWNNGRSPARLAVLVAGGALSLAAFMHPTPQNIVVDALGSREVSSLHGRTTVWRIALDEFERSPLIGYGPGLFSPQYRRNLNAGLSWLGQGHNQYIQTLGEAGLVGLVGLLVFLTALTWAAFKGTSRTSALSTALALAILVRCVTEVPLRNRGLDVSLFEVYLLFVLVLVARRPQDEADDHGAPMAAEVARPTVGAGQR